MKGCHREPSPPDPVIPLERYRAEHPEIEISSPLDTQTGYWVARVGGERVASAPDITRLLAALSKYHGGTSGEHSGRITGDYRGC